jgi:hypothetical protein
MKTVGKEFVDFLCEEFSLTFGQNMFYLNAPDVQSDIYWLVPSNSLISKTLRTKQLVNEYRFIFYYRNTNAQKVEETLFQMSQIISHITCLKLPDYTIYNTEVANLGTFLDADSEGRHRGSIEIVLRVYDNYS